VAVQVAILALRMSVSLFKVIMTVCMSAICSVARVRVVLIEVRRLQIVITAAWTQGQTNPASLMMTISLSKVSVDKPEQLE